MPRLIDQEDLEAVMLQILKAQHFHKQLMDKGMQGTHSLFTSTYFQEMIIKHV